MAVRLPLGSTWRAVRPPREMPPHTMTDPPPNRSCWRMLQAAERSPRCLQTVTSVTCAQCEPAFICEEHRAPVANLPILVFSGKCQTVLGCKHNSHLWTSRPHTTLMESVSDHLNRHMHICALQNDLQVWWWHFFGGPHTPPCARLTAIRYRDEILRPPVRPYAGAVGPGFLLMQNNARPHVAGVCQQFLQEESIDTMNWPANFPRPESN